MFGCFIIVMSNSYISTIPNLVYDWLNIKEDINI